jgi:catechol 2,3-dioxygenase-like lactoylglutathione lyase family enzyme
MDARTHTHHVRALAPPRRVQASLGRARGFNIGGSPMTITLNHTIVPARDKEAAAHFFAQIFGLHFEGRGGHFAPVRVNDTLTLDFADEEGPITSQHYAFHVSNAEFDSILQRVKAAGLAIGSSPWSLDDGKLNDWNGGRGFYFKDPDGHVIELMTVPQ